MILDTFMFRGEFDMLEFRLNELKGRVDHHLLIESAFTHRGEPKPLFFQENKNQFAEWDISSVVVHAFPPPHPAHDARQAAWAREHYQRDSARPFIEDFCAPDDVVLISDLDEFPSDKALEWDGQTAVALLQRTFHSAADWEYLDQQYTSVLARAEMVAERGLAATRDGRYGYPVIRDGGWHFSWLGTTQDRQDKLGLTCHLEMSQEEYGDLHSGASWESGTHHANDANVKAVDVDATWPRWIYERRCPASWFRPRVVVNSSGGGS